MFRIHFAGAVSIAAIIAAATPAIAQSTADSAERTIAAADEIIVEGRYLSLDKLNAVKTPTPLIDIPQSLSIISSEAIADQAYNDFGDVLRYTPGLSISQGEGHRDAVIIRGNQTTADFFLNGIRDDVQYFRPFYNVEQIEILRGSNALLFGRGGVGGIINRVSKRPDFEEQFVGFSAGVDTFGAYEVSGDVNHALGENSAVRLNAFYEGLNNHRDFFDGERYAINPTIAFKATPDTEILFSYEYLNDDRVVDRGVPSQNVENGPDVPLEGFNNTFFGSQTLNVTTLEAHILRGRIDHTFSDALRGNFTAQYADYDKVYQNLFPSEEVVVTNGAFPAVELDGYRDTTDRQNLILQGNLVGEFETGAFGHTFLFGAEYGDQDTANARNDNVFDVNGSGILGDEVGGVADDDQFFVPFTDPLTLPLFGFVDPARNRVSDVEFISVYFQDQIEVTDWLKIVGGVRYDSFDITVNDIFNAGQFSRKDTRWTPRGGAIVKPVENFSAYFSYSETFLPQSGDQFLTLNLDSESTRPQITRNKELGVKWDIRPDLSLTAALFDLDRESFASIDPEDAGQVIIIEGSETKGFEVQLTGRLTEWWRVSTGYSYLDGEVQIADGSGNNGNRPRQTPENMFSIWNNIQVSDRLGFGVGATYQDSFFVREDNTVEVPSFTRVDAALFYDLSDRLRVQVNVENVLDTDYFPDAHSNDNISTGAPLNARFTIRGKL